MKSEIKPGVAAVIIVAALAAIGLVFVKATTVGNVPPMGKGNPSPFNPGGAAVAGYKPPPSAKGSTGAPPGMTGMNPGQPPQPAKQ